MGYEEIMSASNSNSPDGASDALSSRLGQFRKWLTGDAKCVVHPSVCIVNGEATDGTKNAPVLVFGPSQSTDPPSGPIPGSGGHGRCGIIDHDADRALYDRTMGCQVRAARELKKDDVMMKVPLSSFITPDLIAASDAGRAILACCGLPPEEDRGSSPKYWDFFADTAESEKRNAEKHGTAHGPHLLVKILQERKKVEQCIDRAEKAIRAAEQKLDKQSESLPLDLKHDLVAPGVLSRRAPVLAFLIHQRFSPVTKPSVSTKNGDAVSDTGNASATKNNIRDAAKVVERAKLPTDAPETFAPYARTIPSFILLPICWQRLELGLLAGCIPGTAPLLEVLARTMLLASDLVALIDAGILHRFPHIFPPGLITWDRWVWAASAFSSRAFPVSCYLNQGEESAASHVKRSTENFDSPPDVWDELGVMIPLLDMLNHESEGNQITWERPGAVDSTQEALFGENESDPPYAQAVFHKRVKERLPSLQQLRTFENKERKKGIPNLCDLLFSSDFFAVQSITSLCIF